jgi:hypothetical protein
VEVPVARETVKLVQIDGSESVVTVRDRRLALELPGDRKMARPVFVVDRGSQE